MDTVAVLGMDLHRDFSKAVMMTAEGKVIESKNILHEGREEMADFFEGFDAGTDVVMCSTGRGKSPHGAAVGAPHHRAGDRIYPL